MSEEPVLYEMIDGIAILTLNNPAKRNALSLAVLAALKSHLGSIKDDPTVRVVVVRSQGPVFSSGYDLTEMAGGDEASYQRLFDACSEAMEARGWGRDVCGYLKQYVGSMLIDKGPWGPFPKPDYIFQSVDCDLESSWYNMVAQHLDIPLFLRKSSQTTNNKHKR